MSDLIDDADVTVRCSCGKIVYFTVPVDDRSEQFERLKQRHAALVEAAKQAQHCLRRAISLIWNELEAKHVELEKRNARLAAAARAVVVEAERSTSDPKRYYMSMFVHKRIEQLKAELEASDDDT